MAPGWVPEEYLESAVREVLTAEDSTVDGTVGYAALLLACCGFAEDADRLAERWHARTERPATALAADPVDARSWAMLFSARDSRPGWADALPPLDLDAEESAHLGYLARREPSVPAGILGDSTAAKVVTGVADKLDDDPMPDPVREAAAEVESLARKGNLSDAREAIGRWAECARRTARPKVATLGGCRAVAPLLVEGALADALGVGEDWARQCSGDLMAALRTRYPGERRALAWPELVAEILRLRESTEPPPPPATTAALAEAERRLGVTLPADYREFLLTCNGLPADVVFPRLLSVAELEVADGPVVLISDRSETGAVTLAKAGDEWLTVAWDPAIGSTAHHGFRALLEEHHQLLAES